MRATLWTVAALSSAAAAGAWHDDPPPAVALADINVVVIPAVPNCIELRAAEELAQAVPILSGRSGPLTIAREPLPPGPPPPGPRVFVGATNARMRRVALPSLPPGGPLRPEEGVAAAVGGDVFVFGDDAGAPNASLALLDGADGSGASGVAPHDDPCTSKELGQLPKCVGVEAASSAGGCRAGTFYAATSLLRSLGMRWVWPGDDGVVTPPPNASASLPGDLARRAAPPLTLRRLRPNPLLALDWSFVSQTLGPWFNATLATTEVHAEAVWMLRNGLGGRTSVPWGQAFMSSWQQYGSEHPEWFALHRDGTRGCQNISDCSGNPAIVKIDPTNLDLAKHVASLLQPGDLGVSACEDDDNTGFCTCDKCRAVDPPNRNGSLSDRYTYFWNQVHRALRVAGHADAWVGAYAYENYTQPPLVQRFDKESKVLVLSVGFGSVLDWDAATTASRDGWAGWVAAGAAGMAMRPNSLWAEYTGLPFVFSRQWIEDVVWCGKNAMLAADFDSLVGDHAAVGPSYYALARTLSDPAASNTDAILSEYYDAFGRAGPAMRAYMRFWRAWAQRTYTDPAVLAKLKAYTTHGNPLYLGYQRSQYVMAGELYTPRVLANASALLATAERECGSGPADAAACARVARWRAHLDYTGKFAAVASARAATHSPTKPGWEDCTVPASGVISAAQELQQAAAALAGRFIVNVYYVMEKAAERGDLLSAGLASDAPPLGSGLRPAFMLSTRLWFMRLDPFDVGERDKWWEPNGGPTPGNWSRTGVGCPGGCNSSALQAWAASHKGVPYGGVSWWRVSGLCNPTCCAPLLGASNVTHIFLRSGGGATAVTAWLNGNKIGGCAGEAECARPLVLPVKPSAPQAAGGAGAADAAGTSGGDTLVLMINASSAATGRLPRVFTVW